MGKKLKKTLNFKSYWDFGIQAAVDLGVEVDKYNIGVLKDVDEDVSCEQNVQQTNDHK